uniref:Olfactory receptor n=1 Tax=Cricetulus griseus TaxID=10029 RepID=A0A8C2QJI5_CRIGR
MLVLILLDSQLHTPMYFFLSNLSFVDCVYASAVTPKTKMALMENISVATGFILVGLTDAPELQLPLFIIFTLIYLITLIGNLGMIMLILMDARLHTPMYFFLSNLSLVDCVYASAVTPKVMEGLLTGDKMISSKACAAQMFFFAAFATIESFILASMALDRHAAVCKPLHYSTIMTNPMCVLMVTVSYICGLLQSSIHVAFTFRLSFCYSNVINHFFCDIPPLLALSCSDIHVNEIIVFMLALFDVVFTLFIILNSYLLIFITILRMHSAECRKKAFSTCASHLTTVSIFFGTIIFMYLQPNSSHSMDTDKIASVFYTMVIPMLNPLVYSLRNKEVKTAFKKVVGKSKS